MKSKRRNVIAVFLFLLIIGFSGFFAYEYINKVIPIKKKMTTLDKLNNKYTKLEKKYKKTEEESKKIAEKEKANTEKKESLEKTLKELQIKAGVKIVYLTFDDGPSIYTEDILNTLDKYNVKATFFVTCSDNLEALSKKIVEKGHTIALHTCTHKYSQVYSSDEKYYEDLNNISSLVEKYTGVKSKYIRFPGGASNTVSKHYSQGIMSRLTKSVGERGYKYFDWNIDSNDAGGANSEQVYSNVIGALRNSDRGTNMVLMHDVKVATRDALDRVIKDALDMGYIFSNINDYTSEIHHGVNN